jgi:hypothetical protein
LEEKKLQPFIYQTVLSPDTNASNFITYHRIQYEGESWVIYDGNGKRESTNGTWLFVNKEYDLQNNKAEGILFKTSLIE